MDIVTTERERIHARLNALTVPPCGFVPLRETCEVLAEHEGPYVARIAELETAQSELVDALRHMTKLAAMVQSVFLTDKEMDNIEAARALLARIDGE